MTRAPRPSRILLLTGEASGDRYGALLVRAVRERLPGAIFHGIGGTAMREAGVGLLYESQHIAVTGILEVFGALGSVLAAWRAARAQLVRERPNLVILIDYPDFNLRFARVARRAGLPVVYFVGPQVWAWRRYRIRQIERDVNQMLVILPFEEAFYRERGVAARFVGHPLVDLVAEPPERGEAAEALGIDSSLPVLGLLPGSRRNEVRQLLPVMLDAAGRVLARRQGLQCVLPVASSLETSMLREYLDVARVPVHLVEGDFQRAVGACHAVLVASGTATLETGLLGIPMVIAYRVSPWTFRVARRLGSLADVGLPNLILGRRAVPELIQDECLPAPLADAVLPLLDETPERARVVSALGELRGRLGGGGAIERAADAVVEIVRNRAEVVPGVP